MGWNDHINDGYDPGAGLSEASAYEERLNAGWYDDPSEDFFDLYGEEVDE